MNSLNYQYTWKKLNPQYIEFPRLEAALFTITKHGVYYIMALVGLHFIQNWK